MTDSLDTRVQSHTHATAMDAPPTGAARSGRAGVPAAVITCSDSAARRGAPDESGRLAIAALHALGHQTESEVVVVPDEIGAIVEAIRTAIAAGNRIVVTTGGTGAGPRDVTPEAIRSLGVRELPGLGEAIRAASREQVPTADLSRAFGCVLDGTVVLALPGSPGGVRDGLAAVGSLLGHAVDMAAGGGHPGARRAHGHAHEAPPEPRSAGELVRETSITADEVAAAVSRSQAGAVVTFVGTVRDHDEGRAVVQLAYEAHPRASDVLAEVLAETHARPGVLGAAALHRVGELAVGDVAFVAAVSAAHRSEAFAACAWLVDEVKSRVPVWKHQHFADGTDEWVNSA